MGLLQTGIWLISTKMLKHILVVAAIMLHVVASQPLDINVEVTVTGVKIPISQNPIAEASSGSSSGTKAGAFTLWPANQTSPQAGAKAGAFTLWPASWCQSWCQSWSFHPLARRRFWFR